MKPWIGDEMKWGTTTCSFSVEPGAPDCPERAVHHLMTDKVNPDGSYACLSSCLTHFAIASLVSIDSHPIGGVCNMPDTIWIIGTPDNPGRCIWPAAEEANAVQTVLQPEPAFEEQAVSA